MQGDPASKSRGINVLDPYRNPLLLPQLQHGINHVQVLDVEETYSTGRNVGGARTSMASVRRLAHSHTNTKTAKIILTPG
jgi:hypothetical protein